MPASHARLLKAGEQTLELGRRPLVMGIVNATPDSFSDGGAYGDLDARVERARELLDAGADMIDVGGESGVTVGTPVAAADEIERVVPLIEAIVDDLGAIASVDTYKPAVARAAIEAGASIVNDPSGLIDPELARVCADTGAALVLTHTRARPKQKLRDPRYADVTEDVKRFLAARMSHAQHTRRRGASSCFSASGPIWARSRRRRSRCCAGSTSCTSSAGRCCWRSRARTSSARWSSARRVSGWPARWPRSHTWFRRARTCCACTTWPRRWTS